VHRCLVYPEPPLSRSRPFRAEGAFCGVLARIVGFHPGRWKPSKLILAAAIISSDACCFFDALGMKFRELKLRKNSNCPRCAERIPPITKLSNYSNEILRRARVKKAPAPPYKFRKLLRAN